MKLRLVLVATVLGLTLTASAQGAYPNSIASTGDSITRAFNDCWFPYVDCPSASRSTGPRATRITAASRRSTSASPAGRTTMPSPAPTWPTCPARCRA